MAPKPDTTHPIKLILPYVDSVAGNINIAEAIMLPITKEVLVQMPIFFGEAIVQATKSALQIQISVTCSLLNLTDIILWWKNRLYHCLIITNYMKRMLISLKKKVDPSHRLIATQYVTDEELAEIRKKYGNQFDPEDPIIQYLNDQLVMVSFVVWVQD